MARKKSKKPVDVRLWSRRVMGSLSRKRNITVYANERNFPFVVQIAVPDGGFGSKLEAINAWHRYSKNKQRRGRPQSLGEKKFWRWCFKSSETAEQFSRRFGGELVPAMAPRRSQQGLDPIAVTDKTLSDTNEREAEATPCG